MLAKKTSGFDEKNPLAQVIEGYKAKRPLCSGLLAV